jgi:DNA transformation protein and related proteins
LPSQLQGEAQPIISTDSPESDSPLNSNVGVTKMTSPSDVLTTALQLLSGIGELRTRKMFGGTYIYCDDLFIATVHDNVLYLKANASTAQEFVARGLRPFSYSSAAGTVTLQYYQAPPEVFAGRKQMKPWAMKALTAAKQDASRKRRTAGT